MKKPLDQRVLGTIRLGRMMKPGDRIAVAVSGGADSVALLRLLLSLRSVLGITLLAAHFDHSLRGSDSDADAQFVAGLAHANGIEYVCEKVDVGAKASERRLNLEDAARRLRHTFFHQIVEQGRATSVAVAHTADDQAETVLARLFRGTGPTGLAGIYPVLGPIVRPLLETRREELREYLRGLGQSWREDLTNFDLSRQRARIRAQLLPVLEKDFTPHIVNHLAEVARLSREEQEFWNALVDRRMCALVREVDGRFTIQVRDLISPLGLGRCATGAPDDIQPQCTLEERALTERLIRRLYEKVRGSRHDLSAVHVEQVIRLAAKSVSGNKSELPGGVIAERNFGNLVFSQSARMRRRPGIAGETEPTPPAYQYVVELPREGVAAISVPELNTRFLLKVIDWSSRERDTKREDTLDAELLSPTLILRNWEPGDSYRPVGHRKSRKLKQLFLARRVPRVERMRWPVIECGGRIVWARNMPPAGDFCAGDQTKVALRIEERS